MGFINPVLRHDLYRQSNNSKECMLNLPLLAFNHGIEFQGSICNGCHDLTMLCLNISNIGIIAVKGVDYH